MPLSHSCLTGQHNWCANRNEDESHCICACHLRSTPKAILIITLTKESGEVDSELKLWHSWDSLSIDPIKKEVMVSGQTFNHTYVLNDRIKIKVINTEAEE